MLRVRRLVLEQHEADLRVLPNLRWPGAVEHFRSPLIVQGIYRPRQHLFRVPTLASSHHLGNLQPKLLDRAIDEAECVDVSHGAETLDNSFGL